MLGSLARKMRALGYDTKYYRSGTDAGIAEMARMSGRVVLTSDRALAERAARGRFRAILVSGSTDGSRLSSIATAATRQGLEVVPGDSRCSVCNGTLSKLPRPEAAKRVPSGVLRRHRLFFACDFCGQAYWRGGHWKKLRSLRGRLGQT